jgi:hypothetical protein
MLMNLSGKTIKIFLAIIAFAGLFALTGQLYIAIADRETSLPEAVIRFFGFFTIQSNILVTLCAAVILLKPASAWGRFFSRATTISALTVYIIIVGLIYNLVLRKLYHLKGLHHFDDEIMHVAIPLLFVFFWIRFVPKHRLKWNIFPWLIYPIIYVICIMIRGAFVGYYPYFFLNAAKYGYPMVLLIIAGLLAIFIILSLLLVALGKRLSEP